MVNNPILIRGNIVDVFNKKIYKGEITIINGYIKNIVPIEFKVDNYILPGFIDSHIHIESTMLPPSIYSSEAVKYGVIAAVSDPHEICNVCGMKGIEYMINNGLKSDFHFFFGAPSCVPATKFETNGASISALEIKHLFINYKLKFLSEVMNFPDVLNNEITILKKINLAKKYNKKIDGHAPGITGDQLIRYFNVGISTDHECVTLNEALEKLKIGVKIQIREGSAAKNFDDLKILINLYPDDVMICSDDLHPDDLKSGYLNKILKRAIENKISIFNFIKSISVNPIFHYNLPIGLLRINDPADFIVIDNFEECNVIQTFIKGKLVFNASDKNDIIKKTFEPINNFNAGPINISQLSVQNVGKKIKVINAIDKNLTTKSFTTIPKTLFGNVVSDIENDILKIVVVNRYSDTKPQVAFINGFGLQQGAFASSISHDSHNIISIGTNDLDILNAINHIIELKGGIVVVSNDYFLDLPLSIAGLMSSESFKTVASKYCQIQDKIKQFGCKMTSPLMTLSFMALLVIPELKISDLGLFDVKSFHYTSLFE